MRKAALAIGFVCVLAGWGSMATGGEEAEKPIEPKEKTVLFDGKSFEGWHRQLFRDGDVDRTWQIKDGGILYCSGSPPGYIRTEKAYKNYHFRLEYRWSSRPGEDRVRTGNNGVLVHMVGQDGRGWPKSLECQGAYRAQGDFWEIGGFRFNEHKSGGHRVRGRNVHKYDPHNEKKPGEWSVYEVWAVGDVVRPYVNGKLMNEASGCQITAGKICLQSEGAPIEFRNITIEPPTDKPWPVTPTAKVVLFNGTDLTGWVRFIPGDRRGPDKKWTVDKVWSVKDGVIRCEGRPAGYIRTVEDYANYKLHLEWRWPEKPTNSGVLVHKVGIDRVWPKCIEAQLMSRTAGDFFIIGGTSMKVGGVVKRGHAPKKHPTNEKPIGEWNAYDIVCDGGTIKLTINGLLQNEGTEASVTSGKILLQSEGSPIEFRNIYLEPLEK